MKPELPRDNYAQRTPVFKTASDCSESNVRVIVHAGVPSSATEREVWVLACRHLKPLQLAPSDSDVG